MNKDLDKKLKLYIAKMAAAEMPFGGSEWDSSAQILEDTLKKRGINIKLYHEYKMPGGVSQREFMNKLLLLEFFEDFHPKYAFKVFFDKKLTASDKAKIFQYVWNTRRKFIREAKQYEAEIRRLNPELADIMVDHPHDIINGATFGFAPAEIRYFGNHHGRNYTQEKQRSGVLWTKYRIRADYVLAPKTAENILVALKLHEQNIEKEK